MHSNPDAFKGRQVELSGKVFNIVDKKIDDSAFQMWQDPLNSEGNTVVVFKNPSIKIATDDFVIVKGVVNGKSEWQNAFNANVVAPQTQYHIALVSH